MQREFEELIKQASYMQKLAQNMSNPSEPSVAAHALGGATIGGGVGGAGAALINTLRKKPLSSGMGLAVGIPAAIGGLMGGQLGRLNKHIHSGMNRPVQMNENIVNSMKQQDEAENAAWQSFNRQHGNQYSQLFDQWQNDPTTVQLMDNMHTAYQSGNPNAIRDASAAYYAHEDAFTRHPVVQKYLSLPGAQLFD